MKTILIFLLSCTLAAAQQLDVMPDTFKVNEEGDTLLLVQHSLSDVSAFRPNITQDRWVKKSEYENNKPIFITQGQLKAILERLDKLEQLAKPKPGNLFDLYRKPSITLLGSPPTLNPN